MVTLRDVVQHAIGKQSRAIHDLKMCARVVEPFEKHGYVSPDGKSFSAKRPSDPQKADWKLGRVKGQRVIAHMSPNSPQWKQYRVARNYASLLLTARLILKSGRESVPPIQELRIAMREGKLAHHAKRGCAHRHAFKAYRYLRKLANRLEHKPDAFAEAQAWADSRLGRGQGRREEAGRDGL